MADDGPPPLQGSDEEELDYVRTSSDEESEESGGDESEEQEEEDDDDDEGPPPMWGDSGSEAEEEVPPSRPPPKAKKTTPAAAAAGKKKAGAADTKASNGKAVKPPAAAGSTKKGKAGGVGGGGRAGKESAASPLWAAFVKSRDVAERLGLTALKKWESFVKEGVATSYTDWYTNQVLCNRSVPKAPFIAGLPEGFPEFCHWVAAGNHSSCEGHLKAGFEPFAKNYVKRVEDDGRPPVAVTRTPPPAQAAEAAAPSGAGAAGAATGRRMAAPVAEPVGGVGGVDPKARKRDRRARKGGAAANGTVNFAQKMQSAITELEGIDAGDDEGSAAALAARGGQQAEDEVRDLMRGGDVLEETEGDELGPGFADSRLPNGTLAMLSHLKRAREYRRRANRQHECLEDELERCLGRLARVEGQYLALVAETTGQEATLASCLKKARPLIDGAFAVVGGDSPAQALGGYDDAIKLLEAHVEKAPAPGAGASERREHQAARDLLAVALCNRSVVSYRLGDAYSGKRDAERAAAECPGPMAQEQLKRSQEYHKTLKATNAASQWTAFASPP